VSHVIDVRLQKVSSFGKQVGVFRSFDSPFKRPSVPPANYAARASWELDGPVQGLLPDQEHPQLRWRVKLNGKLVREPSVELTPSVEEPEMAIKVRDSRPLVMTLHD
jgi:hypothetical protein